VLLGWLGVAATLLAFGGALWWVLELFAHFRPWYVVLLLPSAVCALGLGRRLAAGVMLACALLNLAIVAPAWQGLLDRDGGSAQLRIVVFNLSLRNSNVEDVTRFLAQTRADAAVLLEVGPMWREALDSLRPVYPYQLVHVRDDPFGVALLSAHPCAPCDEIQQETSPPALLGRLALGRDHLWIAGVHAVPPFNGEWTRERDGYLGGISRRLAVLAGPRVLAGDFNTTPWAPGYRELLATGLHDGDRALASWPAFLSFPVVPIDHVLVSKELRVVSKRRGLPLGSDHYPIVVELKLDRD